MRPDNDNSIDQFVEKFVPSTLDGIVRKNRDLCELRLSTEKEIKGLSAISVAIQRGGAVTGVLNQWRFVCINRNELLGGQSHVVTGIEEARNTVWSTSEIVSADMSSGVVQTKSGSVYQLGIKGDGEPDIDILIHICVQIHRWGFGKLLGVPEFFY